MDVLITEVERYPCLYNKKCKSYTNYDLKSEIWAKISMKLGEPEAKVRKRWINLRDSFVKFKKKQSEFRNGLDEDGPPNYRYAKQLEFLRPHIQTRKRTTNFASEAERSFQEHDDQAQDDSDREEILVEEQPVLFPHESEGAGNSSSELQSFPFPPNSHEKKRKYDSQDAMLDYFQSRRVSSEATPFFVHISQVVEKLPPLVQSQLRAQIFELVSRAEIENLSHNDGCS
ncbi:uncharacterized protein [Diadema setosum]|uniref:uncharacterized protein n=1 Tax=Diadema setosum TaxID=31175 RepID=UPI003B3B94F7